MKANKKKVPTIKLIPVTPTVHRLVKIRAAELGRGMGELIGDWAKAP